MIWLRSVFRTHNLQRTQKMKGKRYTTEEKIRILREADGTGRKIQDVCRER